MKKFCTDWEEFNDTNRCNAWVATAVIGSAVIGAGASIYSSDKASKAQTDAAANAQALQWKQYQQTRDDLAPYRNIGSTASDDLTNRLDFLTSPVDVTAELQDPNSTPAKAYDFTKTQGLKAVANSAAARGLGVSGAALKGAANFTTGLADNTYTNLFNMETTNRKNAFDRLKSLVDVGENASAQTGTSGTNAANQSSAAAIGAGNAQAAASNAQGGAITSAANSVGGYMAYRGLYGSNNNNNSNVYGPGAASGGNNGGAVWGV